jgi:hypothetical protein
MQLRTGLGAIGSLFGIRSGQTTAKGAAMRGRKYCSKRVSGLLGFVAACNVATALSAAVVDADVVLTVTGAFVYVGWVFDVVGAAGVDPSVVWQVLRLLFVRTYVKHST